ncbi:MAG: hypothetical protein J7647_32545 [Cyanobacteria bacterium SBLK]|nr:hypothetical protein [Cyanobacteria bacterium SBLK]
MNFDNASQFVAQAIKALMLDNPIATALGILLGYGISGWLPFLAEVTGLPFDAIAQPQLTCMALSLVFINIPNIPKIFKKNYSTILPEHQEALDYVRGLERNGEITQLEATTLYREITKKVMKRLDVSVSSGELSPSDSEREAS